MTSKDVKDTKDVKSAVLPQKVSGVAIAPKPRSRRKVVYEDYVSVDGELGTDSCPDTPPGGKSLGSRAKVVDPRPSPVVAPQKDPLLALVGGDAADADAFILREILALRSGSRRHEGSLAESKHLYVVDTDTFTTTGAESANALANVALGTSVTTRLTNTIALQRLRLKVLIQRHSTGAAGIQDVIMPEIHMCLFRDKTPSAPGTPPIVHGTDTNPPTSAELIFSRLGAAVSPVTERLIVRNPVTEDLYHIYAYERVKFSQQPCDYTSTADFVYGTEFVSKEMNIDLHDVQQIYAGSAATPITNPIYFVLWSDNVDANQGLQFSYNFVSDLEFHDTQDD